MSATTPHVRIIECTSPTELYCHYPTQGNAQPSYVVLDLRDGTLFADYQGEVGEGTLVEVYYGFVRRYDIPLLTGEAANRVLREVLPLAERVAADWERVWDGHNHRARLGEDAQLAEEELQALLELECDGADTVVEWGLEGATNGNEAEEYGIAADTSDERLEEIERDILGGLAECNPGSVAVCPELAEYLRGLRDEQADTDD